MLSRHTGPVNDIAVSHDGRQLATAGADGTVRLWRPDGAATILHGHRGLVFGVTFSSDSRRLVSTGRETVRKFGQYF